MGGKASKHKQAEEERQVIHGIQTRRLHRTQSLREQRSPPSIQRSTRSGSSRTRYENAIQRNLKQTTVSRKKDNALFVAVIDFGTVYTGFGYSTKGEPEEIYTYLHENAVLVTEKMPTVVLMNPNKEFVSFGDGAKTKYIELMKEDKHKDWYYFDRFKMKLFERETPINKEMEIEDILGKPMTAINVFADAIRYIREKLIADMSKVKMQGDRDIHWVLTVPAIWDDLSKQFMREAAQRAGIPSDLLTLALEPEAASLFCKKALRLDKEQTRRYMLVDLGGGTADITCHEVDCNGILKELHPPTGGAFGGTTVDNAFLNVLYRLFGSDVIHAFKKAHLQMYWELLSEFERKKRYFDGSGNVFFKIPLVLLKLYEEMVEESLKESLNQSSFTGKLRFIADKMHISETLMKDIFKTAVTQIKDAVAELLEKVENIENIVFVGGFSESPYLQKVMKEQFENLLLFPQGRWLAVLKGAGIYGHNPYAIVSRKCMYTYGIARMVRFDSRIHPEGKKIRMGGFTFCDDAFCKHIEIGTDVSTYRPEQATAHEYYPSFADQRHAVLEIYRSKEKDPMFVDDDKRNCVGLIKVEIDTKGDIQTKLMVRLIIGGTELIVEVKNEKNGIVTRRFVDFLG